jgi:hypothetical protein
MKRKSKWYAMTAMLFGGATLFQGCLGGFWDGFFNGWPSNGTFSLIIDVLNEELFG